VVWIYRRRQSASSSNEVVPDCGSFEVVILGKKSQYFYWDGIRLAE